MKLANWLLRGLTVVALSLLFIPSIKLPSPGARPRVVLLVDNSLSMNSPGKKREWNGLREILPGLQAQMIPFVFSDSIDKADNLKTISFRGKRTDISKALRNVDLSEADALLIVSDGRHNGPSEPSATDLSVPLYCVSIGDEDILDISIEDALMEDSSNLRIRLRAKGAENLLTRLSVFSEDRRVVSREISVVGDRLTEFAISLPGSFEGKTLRIELDSVAGEDQLENNTFLLKIRPSSREYNILFVAASISRETDQLLAVLRTLPRTTLSTYIELSENKILGNAPASPHAVVIGPMRRNLSATTINLIRDYSQKNIPLIFISAGDELPLELASLFPLDRSGARVQPGELRFAPISQLLFSRWDPSTAVLGDYPATVFMAKKDAVELLGSGNTTIAAEFKLRSIALEFPGLLDITAHEREGFANAVQTILAYAIEKDGFPFSMEIIEATTASIDLTLYSEINLDYSGLSAWLSPDSIPLTLLPQSSSTFRLAGSIPMIDSKDSTKNDYRLNLYWRENFFRPRGKIEIYPATGEQESRGANPGLLAHLASEGGGELLEVDELEEWAESLPIGRKLSFKPLETPFLVILIGLLFIVEIWFRRRIGLP